MSLLHGLLAAFFPPRTEPVDELLPGSRAVVRGTVMPRDLIDSGLTGDRCVYYGYTIEEWRQSGLTGVSDGFWTIVARDEAIVEFYLRDDTGRVLVSPHDARVEGIRGVGAAPVDIGVLGQRAYQLLLSPGDTIEVEGLVDTVQDLFDEGRGYRSRTDCHALRAPEGEQLLIRVLPRTTGPTIEPS